jgi:hypothetical protein
VGLAGKAGEAVDKPKTGVSQPVPRHREINEALAKHTLKKITQ